MTAYVLTGNCNIDQLGILSPSGSASARAGGDTVDTNGFNFTIDGDTRYGTGATTSTSLGSLTINASKGGNIIVDGRYVRLFAYTGGTGNVPAYGSAVASGSGGGYLIGVYSAINVAPTAPGAAMPATGFIKVKGWNGVTFSAGVMAGIGATCSGGDIAGVIEIVGDDAATVNANRLGTFQVRGAWYEFGGATTDGTRTTGYPFPTNGSLTYLAGVWVSSATVSITAASASGGSITYTAAAHGFQVGQDVTITGATPSGFNCADLEITAVTTNTFTVTAADPGSAWSSGGTAYVYEFYPTAGSRSALVAQIPTDVVRGRFCWITTGGAIYFGYDLTNSTGGYCPPSGRKLRAPNVVFQCCATAARTANVVPSTTLTTRYDFTCTGGGVIDIDKASVGWWLSLNQPYSVSLKYTTLLESMTVTECASPLVMKEVGCGQAPGANSQIALNFSLCFAGGTIRNCTWTRIAQAVTGTYVESWSDCSGFTVSGNRIYSLTKAAHATSGARTLTRVVNSTFTKDVLGGTGRNLLVGCDTLTFTDTVYFDNIASSTASGIPMYVWDLGTAPSFRITMDGLSFGGLTMVQPYSGVLNVGVAGCADLKLRNLGTATAPLDMGGARVDGASWARATTTMTVTKTAHGLKAADVLAVMLSSDVAPKAVTTTSATTWAVAAITDANNFTVTVTNSGQTAGQNLSYYPAVASVLVNLVASGATNPLKIQRCYVEHLRTALIATQDNSDKNILMEDVWGCEWGAHLVPMLNSSNRRIMSSPALTAQTSCYGTHWLDCYTTGTPANRAVQSWARTTTVASLTSNSHGLRVGDIILVTYTSAPLAITLGAKTITQQTAAASPNACHNVLTFTCLNASSASGTLSFMPCNGKVAIQMNEPTSDTSTQVALTGGAKFTSAGSLYMPTVNDSATFTMPKNLIGHAEFPWVEPTMGGGTATNYDITYSMNGGTTWKNLLYPRAGGGGSNGSTNVTMTDTTGVASGDYVYGTNIGPGARVQSITNGTTIVVDIANIGTVSGILRFSQLPNEVISDTSAGIPLKVKIKTTTANTTAITFLWWWTSTTAANRQVSESMDLNSVTLTGLPTGCDAFVLTAGTTTLLDQQDSLAGTTYTYTYSGAQTVDIGIIKAGKVPFYIRNLSLTTTDSTIPVALQADRNYQ